tara:strand:+ start:1874 stop:2050 length:177 start_codon:yes stop_codon:yes gene_type:complete
MALPMVTSQLMRTVSESALGGGGDDASAAIREAEQINAEKIKVMSVERIRTGEYRARK